MDFGKIESEGDSTWEEDVEGTTETGTYTDTTTTIFHGETSTITIPLDKAGYKTAEIMATGDISVSPVGNKGHNFYITNDPDEAVGIQEYSTVYSKVAGSSYLSGKVFDRIANDIRLQDAWIDNTVPGIKLTFKNTATSGIETVNFICAYKASQ